MTSKSENTLSAAPLSRGEVLIALAGGVLLALLILHSALLAITVLVGLGVLLIFSGSPLRALALLIFLLPFSQIDILAENLVSLPGSKPVLLLGLFVAIIAILNFRHATTMTALQRWFAILLLSLFVAGVLRSLPHVGLISAAKGEDLNTVRYLLSYLVRPLVYVLPFLIISKFTRGLPGIRFLNTVFFYTMLAFSGYFLYYYVFHVADKGDIMAAWRYVGEALSMHKNAAGAFYVVAFPLLLGRYFSRRNLFSLAGIVLSLLAIAFLYSRTAYFTALAATLAFFVLTRRIRFLPVLGILGAFFILLLSPTVIERATQGIYEEGADIDVVSAGRIYNLWTPLLQEYGQDPAALALGKGRYAILTTQVSQNGVIQNYDHPHNMYLELLLDAGLAGLLPLMLLYLAILLKALAALRRSPPGELREYLAATTASLVSYLLAGLTQGSLLPDLENSFLYAALAMLLVLVRLSETPPPAHSGGADG